jgi:hypothetical protein
MKSYSLLKTDQFDESTYYNYSRFKHGSKKIAREFGKSLAEKLINLNTFEKGNSYVIYDAPYKNVSTASHALKNYLLASLSYDLMNKNCEIKQDKIHRDQSYDNDYGLMTKEERVKAITSDLFSMNPKFIDEKDILVFIDDIKITGAHEDRIKSLLQRYDITNECIFIYLFEYTGSDPKTEHRLNHHGVSDLLDVNDIIRNDEFIFNTRVVKFILNAKLDEFVNFIMYQSDSFQETLFNYSVLNNYYKTDKYKMNFDILKNLLLKRGLIKS